MPPYNSDNVSLTSGQSNSTNPYNTGVSRPPLFTLDTFSSSDFIVKDFVENLSNSAVPTSRRSLPAGSTSTTNAFDPKPLIRAFEQALSRLKTLSEDLEQRENDLSASVQRAQAQHVKNLRSRANELERSVRSFDDLEHSLNGSRDSGGNAAIRIGEKLEELDKQSRRAQDAKFILQCWLEVSTRGDLSSLEAYKRRPNGGVRCAHIARQLLKICHRLDLQSHNKALPIPNGSANHAQSPSIAQKPDTAETIERFLETLEKDLLKQFDDFYRRQNFDGMRECALALKDFNDGTSVVTLFVNQHQFFIDRSQLVAEDMSSNADLWDRLADPDTESPGIEPSLQALIDEVRLVAQEESFIIKKAFPYYEEVLGKFIQRVFQQPIQQRLESVLNKAESVSSLALLRSLQAAKGSLTVLVDDLKAHGLTDHPEPASPQLVSILDQQLDELFIPWSTSSHVEREKRSLEDLYSSLLFNFTTYHSRRKRAPTSYLSSLGARSKEMMSSARNRYIERIDSADLPSSQRAILQRIAGVRSSDKNRNEVEVTKEDGKLSLDYTKRMLKWLAEAVGRALELSGGHEAPRDVREMLTLLIANLGEIYLETALDSAIDQAATNETSKEEPDYSLLSDLKNGVSILHLVLTTIQTLLLPLVVSNVTVRREVERSTQVYIDRMEGKIDTILQKTLDSALAYTARLLSQQKKTDFRPRDDAQLQLDQLQTPTCQAIYKLLSGLYTRASDALSGGVLDTFVLELALGLRSLLLTHFRSYQVSQTGGLVVSRDMTKYIELLKMFKLPEAFDQSIEVLTEVSNLFVIGPEALKDRIRGLESSTLIGVDKADIRPYVLKREDASSIVVQSALNLT